MRGTTYALPRALAARDNAVLRPRDAEDVYVNPRAEFQRLVDNGVLVRIAPGVFAIVPPRFAGRPWRPDLNATALGIAQADYGRDAVALTNASAARHHGVIPRALAVAAVAVPAQRKPMPVGYATVYFTKRDVDRLDLEAVETELTVGWVTTREQTLLDLAARPTFGIDRREAEDAVRALGAVVDWDLAERLAHPQHKVQALEYAKRLMEAA